MLDYGCGYGDIANAVSSLFTGVVGVDIDEQRVVWARKEFPEIQFQLCRRAELDFPDAGFQTIVSIVVINWVDDPDRYLQECRRLLSKGGALVLAAAAPDRSRIFIRKLLGKSPPPQPHWMESLAAMTQRLRRHGFAVQTTDCFYEPFSDGFHTWKGFVNMTTNLPMRVCRATSFAPYYGIKAIA